MMKLTAHVTLKGPAFSPFRAEQDTHLQFSEMSEPAEVAGRGRQRGVPAEGGSARLDPPERLRALSGLNWLLKQLTAYVPTLRLHGAEEIALHLQLDHTGLSRLELTPAQLKQLADLQVPLAIGCHTATPPGRP